MLISDLVLGLVVSLALIFDLRERRIPNWLTIPGLAAGLVIQAVFGGVAGLFVGLGGAAAGVGLLALPYVKGWVGGGDLKLLAAVGALAGAPFAFWALVFGSAIGGVMTVGWLAFTGALITSLGYMFLSWRRKSEAKPAALMAPIPFGPALALGVLMALIVR